MTNEIGKMNANETSANTCATIKLKRKRTDVFVLILIVFLAIFTLIGLTVKREQLGIVPSAVKSSDQSVASTKNSEGLVERSFFVEGTFDENGNAVETYSEGGLNEEENILKNFTSVYEDSEGRVTVAYADGTKYVHEKGAASIKTETIDLDEKLGVAPASADALVERAAEEAAQNVAYAANGGIGGGYAQKAINSDDKILSGAWTQGWGSEVGKNQTSYATIYLSYYLNDGTWRTFQQKGLSGLSYTAGWNTQTDNTWNGGGYGWGNDNQWGAGGGITSGRYFVFWLSARKTAGSDKNDKATAYVKMYNCWLSLRHSNNQTPSVSIVDRGTSGYAYSKYIKLESSTITAGTYSLSMTYKDGNGNNQTKTTSAGSSWKDSLSVATGSKDTNKANHTASGITYTVSTFANASSSNQFTAQTIQVDSGSPQIDKLYIAGSDGKEVTSIQNLSSAKLVIVCKDTGNHGYASGITKLQITGPNGFSKTETVNSGAGGSTVTKEITLSPATQYINGTWTVYAYDYTDSTSQRGSKTYDFYCCDTVAPKISDMTITANNPVVDPGTKTNGEDWTKDSLTVSFKVVDYDFVYGSYQMKNVSEIKKVTLTYVVNGRTYTKETQISANETGGDIKVVSGRETSSRTGKVCSATLSFANLRFDPKAITSMKITVEDAAGNKNTATPIQDNSAANGSKITGRLDTVAPQISAVSANIVDNDGKYTDTLNGDVTNSDSWNSAMTTQKKYAYGDLALTLTVQDFGTKYKSYYSDGTKNFNNGSGIKKLYFYSNANCTEKLAVNGNAKGTTNCNVLEVNKPLVNTDQQVTVIIRYDTKNTEFEGNLYVVSEDYAGNKSDGTTATVTTETWSEQSALSGSTAKTNGVYVYQGVRGITNLGRDSFKPQIVVKDENKNIIASTISDENGEVTFNASAVKKGIGRNYIYPWVKATNDESDKIKIYIDVYYGSSGGTLTYSVNGGDWQKLTGTITALGDYTFEGGSNNPTRSASNPSTWEDASTTYERNPSSASYSYGLRLSTELSIQDDGKTYYTIRFENNAGISTDEATGEKVKDENGNAPTKRIETDDGDALQSFTMTNSVTIVTRRDATAPTVEFLGLKDSSGKFVTQADLLKNYNASNWLYTQDALTAIFKVTEKRNGSGLLQGDNGKDGDSPLSYADSGTMRDTIVGYGSYGRKTDGTYGLYDATRITDTTLIAKNYTKINNSSENLPTSGFRFEFKYTNESNGHSFGYVETGYIGTVEYNDGNGEKDIVGFAISMFDTDKMSRIAGFYDQTEGIYDLTSDFPLRYSFAVTDYVGNIGYAAIDKANRPIPDTKVAGVSEPEEWGDNVLRLCIDPFPIGIVNGKTKFYQLKSSETSGLNEYVKEDDWLADAKNAEEYVMSKVRSEGWAHNFVVAEYYCKSGISGFVPDFKYKDMSTEYKPNGEAISYNLNDLKTDTNGETGGVIYRSGNKVWIAFSSDASKDIQIGLTVSSNAKNANGNNNTDGISDIGGKNFYIRQDVSKPNIDYVFLSTESVVELNNKLLRFDAVKDGEAYRFVLNKAESKGYKDNGLDFIFSAKETYVYIVANDKTNGLLGSGIKTVKFGGKECELTGETDANGSDVYRAEGTYSYETRIAKDTFNIYIEDQQENNVGTEYGGDSSKDDDNDIQAFRMLPVLDEIDPFIKLTDTEYMRDNETKDYAAESDDIGYDRSGLPYSVRKLGQNGSIINSELTVTFAYEIGISGYDLYFRRTDYNSGERLSELTYFTCGRYLPTNYNFEEKGWGRYDVSRWIAGEKADSRDFLGDGQETLTGAQSKERSIEFRMESAKEGLELLFVSGTGKYYAVDLGKLFIDKRAPDVHGGMTIFSVASDKDRQEANFADLQKIWGTEVGDDYTNGDVYIYYYITDPASGIIDDLVLAGGAIEFDADDKPIKNGGTVLEKVTVKDVTVYTVNGKPVSVRKLDENASYTTGDANGVLTINGYVAYTLDEKAEQVTYKDNFDVGYTTVDLTYYRIKVTSAGETILNVIDNANNKTKNAPKYTVNIDKTEVTITVTATTSSSGNEGVTYDGTKYTNRDVNMIWTSVYGTSGFGGFSFNLEDKLSANGNKGEIFVSIPKFTKDAFGKVVMTFYDENGDRQKVTLSETWADGGKGNLAVSVSDGKWKVGSVATTYKVNEEKYGSLTAHAMVNGGWTVSPNQTQAIFKQSADVIDFNNTEESVKGRLPYFTKDTTTGYITMKDYDGTVYTINGVLWQEDFMVSVSDAGTWVVNSYVTNYKVNPIYGSTESLKLIHWTVRTGDVTQYGNLYEVYDISARNDVQQKYAADRKIVETAKKEFAVKIDVVRPEINMHLGNLPEILKGDLLGEWHAIAKALQLYVKDDLSGIAETAKQFGDDRNNKSVENIVLRYKDSMGAAKEAYFVRDGDEDGYGVYYPYLLGDSGVVQTIESMMYLNEHVEYTVVAVDEAGNETTINFTPYIDTFIATIKSITLKKADGTEYINSGKEYAAAWVKDLVEKKINWSEQKVYAEIEVDYGLSGYTLQYRKAVEESTLKNTTVRYEAWTTIDPTEYEVIVGSKKDNGNGTFTEKIKYTIAEKEAASFAYYQFRAISNAQRTELEVYKKSDGTNRSTEKPVGTGSQTYVETEWNAKEIEYPNTAISALTGYSVATDARGKTYGVKIALGANTLSGYVAVDTAAPTLVIGLYKQEGYNSDSTEKYVAYGSDSQTVANAIEVGEDEWTNGKVRMSMNAFSDTTFASGNAIYYRFTEGGNWSDWNLIYYFGGSLKTYTLSGDVWGAGNSNKDIQATSVTNADTFGKTTYMTSLKYFLSDSKNDEMYEFKVENGAGVTSEIYKFGTSETQNGETVKKGIKIDTSTPTVGATAVDTFTKYANGCTQETLATEYNAQMYVSQYNLEEGHVKYTAKNSVIVRVAIANVGFSGVDLMIDDEVIDTIDYETYEKEKDAGKNIYRYYVVDKRGETVQGIKAVSKAGTNSVVFTANVLIDDTTPILYITDIKGTKATNWGWTGEGKNLYSEAAEYWYVSELDVVFGVGRIEGGSFDVQAATTVGGEFVNAAPYSEYTLYYRTTQNGETSEWREFKNGLLTIDGIKENVKYEFKIESASGISYVLNGDVKDNAGNIRKKDGKEYSNKVLVAEIEQATNGKVITGHVVYGGEGDYDDGTNFVFSVDSNKYQYTYGGSVDLGNGEYDRNMAGFVDYNVLKANKDGVFEATADNTFRRGDKIAIEYVAKYDGVSSGANHNYFQYYTVSEAETRSLTHNDTRKLITSNATEKSGAIYVQFEGSDIAITSYFLAEVDVTYGKDEFFMQTDEEFETTGAATYTYTDGSETKTVSVPLVYEYSKYDFCETDTLTGAYKATTSVAENGGAFRVTAATKTKDFVIKYFAINPEHEADYDVNNATDFAYIGRSYYNLDSDGKVDETEMTYLNSNFILNADIAVKKGISGEYAGRFNGNDKNVTILSDGAAITDDYGLFEKISGKVYSFNVTPVSRVTVNTDKQVSIGFVAQELLAGGSISDVSVVADVLIRKMGSGSVFGGVVATSEGTVGSNIFTDVRITNEGNALDCAAVSAVIGSMLSGTSLSGIYAFGEIELYNVTDVKAGMLYGDAEKGQYKMSYVRYFGNNVFVNGSTKTGASMVQDGVTVFGEQAMDIAYDDFVAVGDSDAMFGGIGMATEILTRLYGDFGYVYDGNPSYGKGTNDKPLVISSMDQIKAINGYMNLNFVFGNKVGSIDMSDYDCSVAVNKVFNGTLSTQKGDGGKVVYTKLTNFAGNVTKYSANVFGLFGQLNGKVSDIIFDEIDIDMEYVGTSELYAGIVAAKAYEQAEIANVMFIGTEKVTSSSAKVNVATVVGYVGGSSISDVFDVNNIAVNATEAVVGGIAATVTDIVLPHEAGSVFVLGRTEGYGSRLTVGAVIGKVTGMVTGGSKVYAIKENVYNNGVAQKEQPVGSTTETYGMITESFSSESLRSAEFVTVKGSAFKVVFGGIYPVGGSGNSSDPFMIRTEKDFEYIDLMLYAEYNIEKDITFTDFKTIGDGLVFSGVLKGYTGDDISAEGGKIISLKNVTAPLVYNNTGKITDLGINVQYEATVGARETFRYGAIAIISVGEIKNVTVSGTVTINAKTEDSTLYVSGFVAESRGGGVEGEFGKLQTSISELNITINGGGTVYTGGYAAIVTEGKPKFRYGIATGKIIVKGAKTTYAGLLVGTSHGECEWELGENVSAEYTYSVIVNGSEIPKTDADGNVAKDKFCGLVFETAD